MRRFAAAVLVAVLAGPVLAQTPVLLPTGGSINVVAAGCRGDGRTDCAPALQRLVDGLTGPATLAFPPGRFRFGRTVFVDRPNVELVGAGRRLTELAPVDGTSCPPVVFGVRQVDAGGPVRPAHRPDAFGKLDASIAPNPGAWRGFASDGDGYLGAVANAAQFGCWRDGRWSGWTDPEGLTVEFAADLPDGLAPLMGRTILGLGDDTRPGPWWVGVDGGGTLCVRWFGSDQVGDPNTAAHDLRVAWDGRGVGRFRLAWDHPGGLLTVSESGKVLGRQPYTPGLTFRRPRGHLPFWAGPSPSGEMFVREKRDLPRFAVLAWRVSLGVTAPAADDAGRYRVNPVGPHDGRTVCALMGDTASAQSRLVPLYGWPGSDGWARSFGVLGQASGTWGGIGGNAVRDLSVTHAPLQIGAVLRFRASHVDAYGGPVGLASLPSGASYPVDVEGCDFSGNDAGISLSWCLARLRSVDVSQGGTVYARFAGCGVDWWGGALLNPGPSPRAAVDLIGGDYGGVSSLARLSVDNESDDLAEAGVVADVHLQTDLAVDGLVLSRLGPGACAVLLRGERRGQDVATARVGGLKVWSGDPSVRVSGSGWVVQAPYTMPLAAPQPAQRRSTIVRPALR